MELNMNTRIFYVYIMASRPNGAIYIGVTSDLNSRVYQHKNGVGSKHVKRYNIHRLVYFEQFEDVKFAISREKQLKKWRRSWKNELIETGNPGWDDLNKTLGFN